MSKNKNSIRVSFPWASAEQVAGSQVLIEFGAGEDKRSILVECGLIQGGSTILQEYQANKKKFGFKAKNIDYVFCCHAHADHIGLLPRLYKEGCEAQIIIPSGNYKIMKEMLNDSCKIMQKNAEFLTRKFKKEYYPIYDEEDLSICVERLKEFDSHTKYKLDEHISFEYKGSAHIIGAYQLILWITCNNTIKKIVITSDLGNIKFPQYYTTEFEPVYSGTLLVGESTYCNLKRCANTKDRKKDIEKIVSVIDSVCLDRKSRVLIPAFSLQRFQIMLTILYENFKDRDCPDIYAASPLACRVSDIYEDIIEDESQKEIWKKVKAWDKIHFIDNFDELESIVKNKRPCVFVASSGMINFGYSSFLAKHILPDPNGCIIFCGFMAPGTVGYKIKENNKYITIDGEKYKSNCNAVELKSFSSHMGHDELLQYYGKCSYDKIALVHGEMDDKLKFKPELENELSKNGLSTKVICVNKGVSITI